MAPPKENETKNETNKTTALPNKNQTKMQQARLRPRRTENQTKNATSKTAAPPNKKSFKRPSNSEQ